MTKQVGYRSPPVEHRFKKGVCPNPKGRPKGSRNKQKKVASHPFDERVSYRVKGREKRISCMEALMLYARDFAVKNPGEEKLARMLIGIEYRMHRALRRVLEKPFQKRIVVNDETDPQLGFVCSFEDALFELSAGTLHYAYQPHARAVFEPWLIEEALARLGERRLTREEQSKVVRQTHRPASVNWPAWWEQDLRGKKRRKTIPLAPAFDGEIP